MKRVSILAIPVLIGIITACGSDDDHKSKLNDEIQTHPDGEFVECTQYSWREYGKIDPVFCGFDEGGAPAQRIWMQYVGMDCDSVTYKNHVPASRIRAPDFMVKEYETLDCSNK